MADTEDDVGLKIRLEMCFKVLKAYSWLLDSYILDFFTENHMKRLPKSWRNILKVTPIEEFHELLNLSLNNKNIWPLSIISLKTLTNFLALSRKVGKIETEISARFLKSNKIYFVKSSSWETCHNSPFFTHIKLQNLFLKHVKPKKRYEIFKMAENAAEVATRLNIDYVVDVGSGLGHLSRIMAYGFNLRVCSIETQLDLTIQAEKLDYELEATAAKYLTETQLQEIRNQKPVKLNQTIKSDLTPEEFLRSIESAFKLLHNNLKIGIVGLHPCGDLAATLLKLYTECPQIKFINLVGCCYHKLTTSCNSADDSGFPLSKFCCEKTTGISYEARALACHAIESYTNRLKNKDYNQLKIHCFRATLEKIIQKNWPDLRKSALRNVKSSPELDFGEYCSLALQKLNLVVAKSDLESKETLENLTCWENVVKFYSLRLMLAPLIETFILLDRKMYLLEKGLKCEIVAAFDPLVSPRNQLLVSEKS